MWNPPIWVESSDGRSLLAVDVSVYDLSGELLERWGSADVEAPIAPFLVGGSPEANPLGTHDEIARVLSLVARRGVGFERRTPEVTVAVWMRRARIVIAQPRLPQPEAGEAAIAQLQDELGVGSGDPLPGELVACLARPA